MSRKTILVLGPPREAVGGVPTHIRNLFASPLAERFDLIQFEAGSRGRESPAKDEKIHRTLARLVLSPFHLVAVLLRTRPNLVHINTGMDQKSFWRDSVYLVLCKLTGRKVVMQMHGGSLPDLCARKGMRRIVRAAFSLADEIVVIANSQSRDFERLGIRKGARIIPNAVDITQFTGERDNDEHCGRVRRLAFMSRLIRPKGVFEAMEAVRLLRNEEAFSDLQLDIAGSGPAEAEIAAWIRDHSMEDCIRMVGSVYGKAKIEFLKRADVFVFPSYHREGLPYVIIESLAAGTPVIASKVAGIPDIVTDGVHGILVDAMAPEQVAEALRALNRSPEALQEMSRQCAAWAAEELGFGKFAERFAAVYDELLVS